MHVQQFQAGVRSSCLHGTCDGVGNIVVFQIKEDASAERRDLVDCFRACSCKKLFANFEESNQSNEAFSEGKGGVKPFKIQGNNQPP
jgi:hypothetical protein